MKIAFILDPLDSIKTYKDTSFAMMREAAARGHRIFSIQQEELLWRGGKVLAFARELELTGDPYHWYRASDPVCDSLAAFDAVLMRKDPPFDMEYVYSTYLLELAQKEGARVYNDPRAIRDHNE